MKAYIFEHGCVTQSNLAQHFALSEDGVDAMLEMWIKKGQLSRLVDLDKHNQVKRVRYRPVKHDDIQLTTYS
nr:FeoC-like transcriptional regulator [Vibrio sp. 99-8-1]